MIWISLAVALLSGCDFTEEGCVYYGWMVAESDWGHLAGDQERPPVTEMNMAYYPVTGEATKLEIGRSERFESPVIRRKLHVGTYGLLVFNKGANPVRGMEDRMEDAEIYSDLESVGGKTYITGDQGFVYSDIKDGVEISCDDSTLCDFHPGALVQKIILNVRVKGMTDMFPVRDMSAILDGVTTSRWLATGEKGIGYASRRFDIDRKEGNIYRSEILVFGINNVPRNTLSITGDFGNGITDHVDVDLSRPLNDFTADQIEIDIEIEISPNLGLSASIADWRNHDWGTIIIY